MSIEWEKVEASPDKKYKVDGSSLLELKEKIAELEKKLEEEQSKFKDAKSENDAALEMADDATSTLNQENMELMEQLKEANTKIETLQSELSSSKENSNQNVELQNKINELHTILSNKEQEITNLNSQISDLSAQTSVPASPPIGNREESSIPIPTPNLSSTLPPNIDISQFEALDRTRKQCPNCGASAFNIKEVEDRSKIISYIPKPIYAKKNVCTKCGYEF